MRIIRSFLCLIAALLVGLGSQSANAQFAQINLFSNIPGQANTTDPSLVDPWGISFSPTSPVWIANEGSGVATLYNSTTGKQGLVVTIPGPTTGSQGTPTGTVFNSFSGTGAFNGDNFLFSTLNGQIMGWRGALGTTAETLVSPSTGVSYTGLAIGSVSGNAYAYAPDFLGGKIDVFKGSAAAPDLPGHFIDPNIPAGYSPFNVQTLNGQLYVSFALQDATTHVPVPGVGQGFVDIFNLDGTFSRRLVSQGALNVPWGMAFAPAGFGQFGGDLLVANNGDGIINAFDPTTGAFIGVLTDAQGHPISNALLLALAFGNGTSFSSNALLFTAGDGLFGEIVATPLPAALPMFGSILGAGGFVSWLRKRKRGRARSGS
jgi:uncharacterized protein (TIGR03118 family)